MMKFLTSLFVLLLLGACASHESALTAQDHSRQCRRVAYEVSLDGTPDEQGVYQVCMRSQGYGVIPRLRN